MIVAARRLDRPRTVTQESASFEKLDFSRIAIIIPALNEADNLTILLPQLQSYNPGQVLVCDNGSTDTTRDIVEKHGVRWVYESRRGYGSACYAGTQQLRPECDIVVFIDADLSDDASKLADLVKPVIENDCDFVLGARVVSMREAGSTTFAQRIANWLFPFLIKLGWGFTYTDMGPFRAIRRSCLETMDMKDRAFGWTIEMQIRAVELDLRIREIPVPYRKRSHGQSKISGSLIGAMRAAYWIIRTCCLLWFTKRRRSKQRPLNAV